MAMNEPTVNRHDSCPVCGMSSRIVREGRDYSERLCVRCGMAWVSPLPSRSDARRLYERDPTVHYSRGRESTLAALEARLRQMVPPPRRLLEVGCGAGTFLKIANSAGWDCQGIDLNPASVHEARKRGLDVRIGTISEVNSKRLYECVSFLHSLEYSPTFAQDVRKAWELLRPGGVLVIETPNYAFHRRSRRITALGGLQKGLVLAPTTERRLVGFTDVSLAVLAKQIGFSRVEVGPMRSRSGGNVVEYAIREMVYVISQLISFCSMGRRCVAPNIVMLAIR